MTWVKLCGMTRSEDVSAAVEAGADAVGFVTYEHSPRRVTLDDVARLARGVPIATYLVAVDADPEELVEAARVAGVSGIQPHGTGRLRSTEHAVAAGLDVLVPVQVEGGAPAAPEVPEGARVLFDTGGTGLYGGTGETFDWSLVAGREGEFVIAGGLRPGNVAEAVSRTGAWGVDVAGGVESAPGLKDPELIRRFMEAVR